MATIGFSAKLTESGSDISELVTVTLPAVAVTAVDTTHLGVTNARKTFVPGMVDNGTVAVTAHYSKALYTRLNAMLRSTKSWTLTAPDEDGAGAIAAAVYTFSAFITKLETTFEQEAVAGINFDLKVTGEVTVA